MKKLHLIILSFCLLLSACTLPLEYNGYRLAKTTRVKVFYSKDEAKMDYSVMGRLVSHKYPMDIVVKNFVNYAKNIGGDAIIVLPADPARPNRVYADVLKYR